MHVQSNDHPYPCILPVAELNNSTASLISTIEKASAYDQEYHNHTQHDKLTAPLGRATEHEQLQYIRTGITMTKPKSSFRHLKRGIQDFHMNYVLVPSDKAANNVVVV